MSTDSSHRYQTDVVIVGAGPAGLFAVFQCGMLGMKCHVIDALDEIGGQCVALYPEKPIFDIPAWPRIDAGELIGQLETQAAPFHPVYHIGQKAVSLTRQEDKGWLVETSLKVAIEAPAVILAAGAGAFGPNRPPLEGILAYEGKSIFYLVKRRDDFRGKRVVIAGGGDSAVDWALSLVDVAEHVMVVHRRPKFRAAPDSVEKMQALADEKRLELIIPYHLDHLVGQNGVLEAVGVKTLDGEVRILPADYLLPFFGLANDLSPFSTWGLTIEQGHIPVQPATCETNLPGIYAIGDVAQYPGKLKLILQGFSEAALAAHALYAHVFPGKALHFEHSTTHGVPRSNE